MDMGRSWWWSWASPANESGVDTSDFGLEPLSLKLLLDQVGSILVFIGVEVVEATMNLVADFAGKVAVLVGSEFHGSHHFRTDGDLAAGSQK